MSTLEIAALTHPGQVRANNEDSIATVPELGVVVLADGMGGHQAGEVASGLAVDLISRHMDHALKLDGQTAATDYSHEAHSIVEAIRLANSAIFEASQQRPECAGMGSTVVAAAFYGDKVAIAHVGDSRLYRLRDNELEQITLDHSVVQELLSRGLITPEEAHTAYNKNLVTKALGVDANVEPDINEIKAEAGDIYLLCSDGLNDVLTDTQIRDMLVQDNSSLDALAQRMVDEVNSRGAPDNVSIILIRTNGQFQRGSQ